MRTNDQNGTLYVCHMTWDERCELVLHLKSIKTYDYAYLIPNDMGCNVIAIRAKSAIAITDIPYKLPGLLCINLNGFINMDRTVAKLTNTTPDLYFPSLDDVLKKYIYVAQAEIPYIIDGNDDIIFAPAYHMINHMNDIMLGLNMYKFHSTSSINNGGMIELDENIVSQVVNKMSSMKADDGAVMTAVDPNHIITIFSGMLPLNKADKLSIKIYDQPIENKFLVSYTVFKKKSNPIEVMFFYMRV